MEQRPWISANHRDFGPFEVFEEPAAMAPIMHHASRIKGLIWTGRITAWKERFPSPDSRTRRSEGRIMAELLAITRAGQGVERASLRTHLAVSS